MGTEVHDLEAEAWVAQSRREKPILPESTGHMPYTTADEHSNLDTSRPQKRYLIDILSCFLAYLFRVAIPVLSLFVIYLYFPSHLVVVAPSQGTNAAPHYPLPPNEDSAYCPQTKPIFPLHHAGIDNQLETLYARSQFQLRVFDILKGIIQVPWAFPPIP